MEDKAATADLKKIHEQYFEVGHLCTSLCHEDAAYLAEMPPEIFQKQILGIGIGGFAIPYPLPYWAPKLFSDTPIPVELMDLLEFEIFENADKSSKNILKWLEPVQNFGASKSSTPSASQTFTAHDLQQMLEQ